MHAELRRKHVTLALLWQEYREQHPEGYKNLTGDKRALVLVPDKSEKSENLIKSGRNLTEAKLLQANYLNIRDLLSFEKVIIPLASLEVIKAYLG